MKKLLSTFIIGIAFQAIINAQSIGIGSTVFTPDASAMLEVRATNKGVLVPRVSLTGVNDAITVASPATSLLVFNTGGALPAGYYYNTGTPAAPVWLRLLHSRDAWLLTGNSGTDPATNFLGTTDNQPLIIRTNNIERMRVTAAGRVGIGTNAPSNTVHVLSNSDATIYLQSNSAPNPSRFIANASGVQVRFESIIAPVAGGQVMTEGNYPLLFGTNGLERMRILANGRVGVGIATPDGFFHIVGSSGVGRSIIIDNREIKFRGDGVAHFSIFGPDVGRSRLSISNTSASGSTGVETSELMVITSTGNVGIGNNNPSQRLDVTGNVQFSGALMPNGNAGTAGQYLRSQGAGLPPVWFSPAATLIYQNAFNSTASVCINNANWTTHPGVSTTLALQAGDIVFAWGYGAAMADNNCDGALDYVACIIDVRIAINGADFPDGAWVRFGVDYAADNWMPFNGYSIAGRFVVPAAGNYTFALQTRRAGGTGNAITAGDNSSALQSGMFLIVYRP